MFDTSVQALNTPWMPHADGVFLEDGPPQLILKGSVANIPFVVGRFRSTAP